MAASSFIRFPQYFYFRFDWKWFYAAGTTFRCLVDRSRRVIEVTCCQILVLPFLLRPDCPKTHISLFSTLNFFQNTEFRLTSSIERGLGSVDARKIWGKSVSQNSRKLGLIFGDVFRILESLRYLQVCFEYIVGSLDIDFYVNM